MTTLNPQTGNYIAIAGVIVLIANYFKLNLVPSDVEAIIGLVVSAYGVIHTLIGHLQNPPVTA